MGDLFYASVAAVASSSNVLLQRVPQREEPRYICTGFDVYDEWRCLKATEHDYIVSV